ELFVFGSVLTRTGGAILVTFNQMFAPARYQPINHTFMLWVMVLVGGAGHNCGVLLRAELIYTLCILSSTLAPALCLNLHSSSPSLLGSTRPHHASRAQYPATQRHDPGSNCRSGPLPNPLRAGVHEPCRPKPPQARL
ncbi:hypothetical protein VW29_10880, partial [Devosia limi DSM 17137]